MVDFYKKRVGINYYNEVYCSKLARSMGLFSPECKVVFDGDETEGWSFRTSSSGRYVYTMTTFTNYWHNENTNDLSQSPTKCNCNYCKC